LYIARHRRRFERQILAEMLPPREPGQGNRFWDHYGRRMTGLSYREADRLSANDKEFIHALFPDAPIYTLMLPEEIRAAIGEVGEETRGALRILEHAGMRFLNQIDPFDGGPYYGCAIEDLAPVKAYRSYRVAAAEAVQGEAIRYLIAREDSRGYRAVASVAQIRDERMIVPPAILDILDAKIGNRIDAVRLP
jgi:arginine N-succinyltransferase